MAMCHIRVEGLLLISYIKEQEELPHQLNDSRASLPRDVVVDHKCVKEIKDVLLKQCKEKDVLDNLRSFLGVQAQNVGLLVSQRVVNLPPQLLPPLYDALFDEVSWATEDEHKNPCQKEGGHSSSEEATIYNKPEDEIFHQLSSWSFTFPLSTQQLSTHELRNYKLVGLVIALEAEKVPTFRHRLHSLINET
ncbi:CDK inhibitor P21 binding protein [Actinidia rufa]|uniref:CDK inhibitor P21 binding protein n=1 Tax=Actinidia rufa TaxID=165716 RepID=A0A7J0DE30_9ERIC|nr:CDK inhibitor P21 binding protein [Actinidia rufa]